MVFFANDSIQQTMEACGLTVELLSRPFYSLEPIQQLIIEGILSVIVPLYPGQSVTLTHSNGALVISVSNCHGYLLTIQQSAGFAQVSVSEFSLGYDNKATPDRYFTRRYPASEPVPVVSEIAKKLCQNRPTH